MSAADKCPRCWRPVAGPGAQTCNRPHGATEDPASTRLRAAADAVDGWPEPYAEPLAELLRAEADHAAALERDSESAGWDRYPPGGCLLRLADGVLTDEAGPTTGQTRPCRHAPQETADA